MGAKSGNRVGSETASEEVAESDPGSSPSGSDGTLSRSTRDVVYLADDAVDSSAYHTSRLCPDFPGAGEILPRPAAEDEGHPFCWTCFELEMRALQAD